MFEVSTDGSANNYTTDAYGALSVRPDPSSSQTREFRWYNTADSAYVSLKSDGAMASSYDLTWPRVAPPGNNYILQSNSSGDFSWIATPSSGTDNTLNANVTDVLSLSTQEINAVDATADKLVFWDDSASKLTYATLGTNLTFTGTTLDATGGVDTSGTPSDNQLAVFTDSDTIEGDSNLTWDGTKLSADALDLEYSTTLAVAGNYAQGSKVSYNFGTTSSVTRGDVHYFNGGWAQSDADTVSSASGLLAVAVGTSSTSGMVLSGVVRVHDSTGFSSASEGDVLYLDTDDGHVTVTAPSATGDVVRVVGYVINVTNKIIYFDPSSDWIELS